MNQKRTLFVAALIVITILSGSFIWFRSRPDAQASPANNDSKSNSTQVNNTESTGKVEVVASFYPLYEFSKQVGGTLVNVTNVTPPGVEPHDFEPSSLQIAQIQNANVFIFNGGGLDPWAEKIAPELEQKGLKVIEMTSLLKSDLIAATEDDHDHGQDEKSEPHSEFDPHIWLDPVLAQKQIQQIQQVLAQVDPKNTSIYQDNSKLYAQKLVDLDLEYRRLLSNCSQKTVVSSHNAFSYLAKQYNFEVVSASGLSPEVEPSLKDMAKTIELVKEKKIKYIAFETLVSPKISQTIAAETGAATIILNPIEGLTQEELDGGANYLSIMQENLNNLRTILECK